MNSNSRLIGILIVAAMALSLGPVAQAGMLYTLPLPSGPGVNDPPTRINFSYSVANNPGAVLLGGDVYNDPLVNLGAGWDVNSLTLWAIGNIPIEPTGSTRVDNGQPITFEYSNGLTLYGGVYQDGASVMQQVGDVVTTGTQVWYSSSYDGTTNYASASSSNYYAIWQVTFTGLNIDIPSGADYAFGLLSSAPDSPVSLQLTSECLPDNCNSFGVMNFVQGVGNTYTVNGAYPVGDVNITLLGTATPEPATWLLLGAGIGVLGLVRRRRG